VTILKNKKSFPGKKRHIDLLPLQRKTVELNELKHISGNEQVQIAKGPLYEAQRALKIIWFTGVVCMFTVLLFFYNSSVYGMDSSPSLSVEKESIQSIDQLLLSSDEAQLIDNKSFVNSALRFQWRNQEPDLNQGNNRSLLYNNILKKKLQRLVRTEEADFSIRPVPK
jgi:hypothetical protein